MSANNKNKKVQPSKSPNPERLHRNDKGVPLSENIIAVNISFVNPKIKGDIFIMQNITELQKVIEQSPARSAWSKGVKEYALELLEQFEEYTAYCKRNGEDLPELNKNVLLNGAQDWDAYSWGGSSLIYDCDIAERLCSPSELKKSRNGDRRPNSREEWLDVQARALYQAANLILRTIAKLAAAQRESA